MAKKCTKSYNTCAQLLLCSLYIKDGPLFGDPQNTSYNENHEKFQHFRFQRKKSSLTSHCVLKGKISGGINGFSSLTVDLACSSKSCLSHLAESNLDTQSPLSLLFLVYGFLIFAEFASAKLSLLAHPNRGYS